LSNVASGRAATQQPASKGKQLCIVSFRAINSLSLVPGPAARAGDCLRLGTRQIKFFLAEWQGGAATAGMTMALADFLWKTVTSRLLRTVYPRLLEPHAPQHFDEEREREREANEQVRAAREDEPPGKLPAGIASSLSSAAASSSSWSTAAASSIPGALLQREDVRYDARLLSHGFRKRIDSEAFARVFRLPSDQVLLTRAPCRVWLSSAAGDPHLFDATLFLAERFLCLAWRQKPRLSKRALLSTKLTSARLQTLLLPLPLAEVDRVCTQTAPLALSERRDTCLCVANCFHELRILPLEPDRLSTLARHIERMWKAARNNAQHRAQQQRHRQLLAEAGGAQPGAGTGGADAMGGAPHSNHPHSFHQMKAFYALREHFAPNIEERERLQLRRWSTYFCENGKAGVMLRRTSDLLALVSRGIPEELRGELWQCLSGSRNRERNVFSKCSQVDVKASDYEVILRHHHRHPEQFVWEEIIERDLHRSMPEHPVYASDAGGKGQSALRRVLLAFSFKVGPCLCVCVSVARVHFLCVSTCAIALVGVLR
jgi:Rab-GTPase-TBC domain